MLDVKTMVKLILTRLVSFVKEKIDVNKKLIPNKITFNREVMIRYNLV